MCLNIKSGCKIEVAERPIPVYKYVDRRGDNKILWINTWKSIVRRTIHRYNRLLTACLHLKTNVLGNIDKGFHAYIKNSGGEYRHGLRYAIIPKGAEYCFGTFDEIVANQMIVFSSKKKFEKYININTNK